METISDIKKIIKLNCENRLKSNESEAAPLLRCFKYFDLNNDGILDLISGGWETPTTGLDGNIIEDWRNRTELSYGNGDGTFDIENSIQFPEIDYWGKVNGFLFHDIDNDGDIENIINRTKGHEDFPSVDNDNSYGEI